MADAGASDPFGLVGSVVGGQFRLDAVIGEGGFAVVYKGWHLSLDQPIALKALKLDARDAGLQGALLAKFREEAKLTYVLSQATLNIVRIIDFGATTAPAGAWVPFAVQEWLDGETLAEELRRRRKQGMRGRSLAEAMKVMEPAARALGIAHQRRVVHRDVKPGNFFLMSPAIDAQGVVLKVLDFGIAKVLREGATHSGTTSSGMVSFTPQYAAPEQIESRYGAMGPWTDVYSLGLVMTELLTDRPPFEGDDLPAILAQAFDPQRRPTPRARGIAVPDALEAVLTRALAVDPRARHADAAELWAALQLAAMPVPTRVPTPPPGSIQALPPEYRTGRFPPLALPSPGAPRAANLVAIIVGIGLGLVVLLSLATWIVTRR